MLSVENKSSLLAKYASLFLWLHVNFTLYLRRKSPFHVFPEPFAVSSGQLSIYDGLVGDFSGMVNARPFVLFNSRRINRLAHAKLFKHR